MTELQRASSQDHPNPLTQQAEHADAAYDRVEIQANEQRAAQYHAQLSHEEILGAGTSKASRLAAILASKLII